MGASISPAWYGELQGQYNHDDNANGESMTDRDRRQGPPHRPARSLLQAERDGKEPAHAGIEPVKCTEPDQSQPRGGISHDSRIKRMIFPERAR